MKNVDATLIVHPYTARKDLGFGHDRYAFEMQKHLPQAGVNVSLLQTGEHKSIPAALLAEGRAILRLLGDRRAQIFHGTATANSQCALTAHKRPIVTTIHDVLWFFVQAKYDSSLKYRLKSAAIRRAAIGSDAIIVPFPSTGDFLVERFKTPRERIHVVHHGVDHTAFYPRRPGENVPRPSFLPKDGRIVLFVGAITLGKGVDTLIRSFPAVVARVPDARLVLGSSGWDMDVIKKLHSESPVRDRITFSGFIPENELRAAYLHADVMTFPSRYGFGLSTLEGMACGTPTVSGRALDAPELIGDCGLMADPNDPEELAHQLTRLLEDRTLHQEIARKGLARAAEFRWEESARQTAEIYRRLV